MEYRVDEQADIRGHILSTEKQIRVGFLYGLRTTGPTWNLPKVQTIHQNWPSNFSSDIILGVTYHAGSRPQATEKSSAAHPWPNGVHCSAAP
jgi:hypothetical protein